MIKSVFLVCVFSASLSVYATQDFDAKSLLVGISLKAKPGSSDYPLGFCKGVAIGARKVLTSARCASVRGQLYIQPLPLGQKRIRVSKVIVAPSYVPENAEYLVIAANNIAVLILDSDLPTYEKNILLPKVFPALATGAFRTCSLVTMRAPGELPSGLRSDEPQVMELPLRLRSNTWAEWRELFVLNRTVLKTTFYDTIPVFTKTAVRTDPGSPIFCDSFFGVKLVGIAAGALTSDIEIIQEIRDFQPWIEGLP